MMWKLSKLDYSLCKHDIEKDLSALNFIMVFKLLD